MQFLNPAFLIGLAAAGIPILLHFLSRQRLITIEFAPLRFLQPSQERQMRRVSRRRLLLLLLRVAAVCLIVLAVARPTLTGGLASLVPSRQNVSAVILVDASASMQAQMSTGTLFDRAREEAAAIAAELGSGDEVSVALFTDGVRPLFGEFVRDPSLVMAELEDATPTYRSHDFVAALSGALDLLERARHEHREVYVLSDFQAVELDSLAVAKLQTRLKGGPATNVFLRQVPAEPFLNRSVVEVERPATLLRSGETAEVAAIVRQDGEASLPMQLFLELDDTAVGETELDVPPGSTRRHVFPTTLPEAGDLSGQVRVRPDRYPADDQRSFVLTVSRRVPALVLRGLGSGEGERDPLLFLLAALDPSGRGEGDFELSIETARDLDVSKLATSHVVIATDLRDLGAARLAAVTEYLESGGTLLLFCGDPRVRAYTNEKLLPEWTSVRLGPFRGGADVFQLLELPALDHPVFAGFEREEIATLEEVQLRNFFPLPEDEGRTLLRYADGGAALLELSVGEGRLMLCGFHTAAAAGNLPYSPMFLPLVQRLAGYLATAGWGRFGRHFEVGETISVEAPVDAVASTSFEVQLPDGSFADATLDASVTPARVELAGTTVPGIYRFQQDGVNWAQCAVNVPLAESRREFVEPRELRESLGGEAAQRIRDLTGDSTADAVRQARSGYGIHRWFLAIAGILLVIESLISRRVAPAGGAKPA